MTKGDITSRSDIELLVNLFYKEVLKDPIIGYLFTEVTPLNLEDHMPIMYDFWESILLGNMKYKANPMEKHLILNEKEPLKEEHLHQWLTLWEQTLCNNFDGPKTNEALTRATQIGKLILFKAQQAKSHQD